MKPVYCVLLLFICSPALLAGQGENPLQGYLENVEVQYENSQQLGNIINALRDALKLPAKELSEKRYCDYTGKAGTWDLRAVLENHFMPDETGKTLGPDFYAQVKTKEVQTRLRQILEELEQAENR